MHRHCEEPSDEAIHFADVDCFAKFILSACKAVEGLASMNKVAKASASA
jgi:hypothetical protein